MGEPKIIQLDTFSKHCVVHINGKKFANLTPGDILVVELLTKSIMIT